MLSLIHFCRLHKLFQKLKKKESEKKVPKFTFLNKQYRVENAENSSPQFYFFPNIRFFFNNLYLEHIGEKLKKNSNNFDVKIAYFTITYNHI